MTALRIIIFENTQIRTALRLIKLHIKRYAREVRCYSCDGQGHIARNFMKKNKNMCNKMKKAVDLNMQGIRFNNRYLQALFDSGSSLNIITREAINKINAKNIILED
ncbi:hypothetical protein DMUE_0768 [Dictyocoela muelleri]|nr:hypothetical protein DMUE_0768 [Dictyocoela muelleri]